LWDHYLSAGVRRFLAQGWGVDEGQARRLLVFVAGVHDIGKAMGCFQIRDGVSFAASHDYPVPVGGRQGHDYAAHVWLTSALAGRGFGGDAAQLIAQLVGGHHGCFFAVDRREVAAPLVVVPELGAGEWERQRRLLVDAVYFVAGEPDPVQELEPAAAAVVCGVVILADWLVSQTDFLMSRLLAVPGRGDRESLRRFFRSALADTAVLVDRAGLGRLVLRSGSFAEEHGLVPPQAPNALQRSVVGQLPGLLTGGAGLLLVLAPMGFGKTETALTGARLLGEAAGAPGVMFALPTMATSDPMYLRLSDYGIRRAVDPAPLALLHSMAWLNSAYLPEDLDAGMSTGDDSDAAVAQRFMIAVAEWLLGVKRGLLAPWATGTIDQVLLAGVRGRHNVVRMLGLAGKVLVVDEVHAYDAYMQQLLCRVLLWLGRLGVPVVLLSATLPRQVARRLVESYLRGAGHRLQEFSFSYPGWLYADAQTGALETFEFDCPATELTVGLRAVPLGADGRVDRLPVVKRILEPLITSQEGCVGIICTTVAEAQQTYRELAAWFAELERDGRIAAGRTLLHSRFPADRREELTTQIVSRYGKNGNRPRGVVVATQVIEQSIDLDFDLIISDLAPAALLLQRAGRGHRHVRDRRPPWASSPRLEVLIPVNAERRPVLPRSWRAVYARSLLRRTAAALYELAGTTAETFGTDGAPEAAPVTGVLGIPGDVQGLMEQVYDQSFADGKMADDDDLENLADEQVQRALADMVVIPDPDDLEDLYRLTDHDIDEALFVTRLGADSGRVVWCYADTEGTGWLDRRYTLQLPQRGVGPQGRFTKEQVKAVLAKSIPVPGPWMAHPAQENLPPDAWATNSYLRTILLLVEHPDRLGGARLGNRYCELDEDLGLYETGTLVPVGESQSSAVRGGAR
jgi:CRISPR-associated endonuclease/helicase Cas3